MAAYYPGDAPMPGWFEGVFAYAIPFGALAIGILATHLAKSKMAAKARQQQPSLEAGKAVELEAPTTYYVAQNGRMEY